MRVLRFCGFGLAALDLLEAYAEFLVDSPCVAEFLGLGALDAVKPAVVGGAVYRGDYAYKLGVALDLLVQPVKALGEL